jgi:hypothetical protein
VGHFSYPVSVLPNQEPDCPRARFLVISHRRSVPLELGAVFLQTFEVSFVILIGTKGVAPLIATNNDVIEKTASPLPYESAL